MSVLVFGKGFLLILDYVIGGKLSCMDCIVDCFVFGVGLYGYGIFGNKVIKYNIVVIKYINIIN